MLRAAERHFKPLPTRGAIFEEIPSDADYEKYVSMAVRSLLIYIQTKKHQIKPLRCLTATRPKARGQMIMMPIRVQSYKRLAIMQAI